MDISALSHDEKWDLANKIKERFILGEPLLKIHENLGARRKDIQKLLAEFFPNFNQRFSKNRLENKHAVIIALVKKGFSITEIGRFVGVNDRTIFNRLSRYSKKFYSSHEKQRSEISIEDKINHLIDERFTSIKKCAFVVNQTEDFTRSIYKRYKFISLSEEEFPIKGIYTGESDSFVDNFEEIF